MKKHALILMLTILMVLALTGTVAAKTCYKEFPAKSGESVEPVGKAGVWKGSELVENIPVFCAFCGSYPNNSPYIKELFLPVYSVPIDGGSDCKKTVAKHSDIDSIKVQYRKNRKHCFFSRSEAMDYFPTLPCAK